MTARTGWLVVYRCGCTDLQPTPDHFQPACPGHGATPINSPELITDKKDDRDLDADPWFGFRDDTDVVVQRPADADVCGRCEGQGQILVTDLYGEAWAICGTCAGTGVRRAAT